MVGSSIFSYNEFEELVRAFAGEMPQLLLRHQATADLAFNLQRVNLLEALEARFTVAIVGQMRVGKSTLLNAIIGKRLAPTGVNETTATINWFRDGQGDLLDRFRVHWTDGSTADFPLSQIGDWLGRGENAVKTRRIEFFADTPFLKSANVVDTPGTRSVIETHENATQGFLAEKLEEDTLRYGGRADAVVYAINPVGRECDAAILQMFGEKTRLPGASAYNSIAVIQKWEHLTPDPVAEVQKKAILLREQLAGRVSDVLPTSGLLANAVECIADDVWHNVAVLATGSTDEAIELLLTDAQDFVADCTGAAADKSVRKSLLVAVGWVLLPLAVRTARRERLASGTALRARLREISGLPRLKSMLHERFFSRSRIIKSSTILHKAVEPCETALLRLRQTESRQTVMKEQGKKALGKVKSAGDTEVYNYIEASLKVVENDIATLEGMSKRIEEMKCGVMKNFEVFDNDIVSLKLLEAQRQRLHWDNEVVQELESLFGQSGPGLMSRLGMANDTPNEAALAKARDRFAFWCGQRRQSVGDRRAICDHARTILELILNYLEKQDI